MSVVTFSASTSINLGNGGYLTTLTAIGSLFPGKVTNNNLAATWNNIVPSKGSISNANFNYFRGKSFGVIQISSNNVAYGTVSITYPTVPTATGVGQIGSGQLSGTNCNFDYFQVSYFTITATATYPRVFSNWNNDSGTSVSSSATINVTSATFTTNSTLTAVFV